jgi:uncharacterized protein
MRGVIEQRLSAIEAEHGCRVLFACESGSRAWGFPSADSDYDVRFVYMYPADWYLCLQERKDTMELALQQDLDFAGWELRKALRLFAGCNLAFNEWLDSPVYYLESGPLRSSLLATIPQYFNPRKAIHHYLSQAQRAWSSKDETAIKLKKLFYALRATLAGCWIEHRRSMPPTQLQAMLVSELLPQALIEHVQDLIAFKQTSSEGCFVTLPPGLEQWIDQKLQELAGSTEAIPPPGHIDWPTLNKLFLALIKADQL